MVAILLPVTLSQQDGTRMVTIPLMALVCLFLLIVVLILIIWSVKRRRDPKLAIHDSNDLDGFLPTITGLTHGAFESGNSIEILENGDEFFPVVMRELRGARESITFEAFLWKKGRLGEEIADILAAKAREGVEVRLLLDASGGKKISRETTKRLLAAGCKVRRFHPFRISNLGTLNNRDHRKIIVVDGRVGFVGGHCIVDTWLGNAEDDKHFRDISVRVEGPIVHRLQSVFAENWIEETGEAISGEKFFKELEPRGTIQAHLSYICTAGSTSCVKLLHYLAIHAAQESMWIQNPYFLPDPDAIDALGKAVERGVDVRVMIPSVEATDNALVQHASHHRFGALLEKGVRIFQYKKTLLHQKVFTVDHKWSAIGSTNFDDRSFEVNDEVTMGILDEGIARQLEQIFEKDCKHAEEVRQDAWKKRTIWHRVVDQLTFLVNEQL